MERWAFEVQQNSVADIAENVQDSIKQRQMSRQLGALGKYNEAEGQL